MRFENQKMQEELNQRDVERRMLRLTQGVIEPAPGNSASHSRGESAIKPSSFYFSPHNGARGVAVYLIVRGSVRDGAGQSFTFRDKRTDEFVLFAVRMKNTGAAKVKARYSPLRFYSSTKAEHAGEFREEIGE